MEAAKASVCSSVSQGQERNLMPRVGLVGFCTSDGHLDESVCFFGNRTRFQPVTRWVRLDPNCVVMGRS